MDRRPIGVFDSGVGGLSILKELTKILPKEDFVFLADQKYVPYGEKTKKELVNLCMNITDYFIKEHKIKMLVIACNTATCYSIKELRQKYSLPIVGTEPAIKPAAENTRTRVIAVISTPATSKSKTLKRLIEEYAKEVTVLNVGCKNLENIVERGELNNPKVKKLLQKYLEKIKNSKTDNLVLGCTHYPFLKKPIAKFLGPHIKLVDSGRAIAKRARSLLFQYSIESKQKKRGKVWYVTTGDAKKFQAVASQLLGKKVTTQKVLI